MLVQEDKAEWTASTLTIFQEVKSSVSFLLWRIRNLHINSQNISHLHHCVAYPGVLACLLPVLPFKS